MSITPSITAIVMLIVSVVFTVIVLLGGLIGSFKGWKCCLVALGRTLVAMILAFFTIFIFCNVFPMGDILGDVAGGFLSGYEGLTDSEALRKTAEITVNSLVMPFVFLIVFIIWDLLLLIPAHFVKRAVDKPAKAEKQNDTVPAEAEAPAVTEAPAVAEVPAEANVPAEEEKPAETARPEKSDKTGKVLSKCGGALICMVNTFVIILVALMPFTALLFPIVDGVTDIAASAEEQKLTVSAGEEPVELLGYDLTDDEGNYDFAAVNSMLDENISPVRNNFYLAASYSAPFRLMCNTMVGGAGTDGELTQLFGLAYNGIALTTPLDKFGDAQKDALTGMSEYISKSDLHAAVVVDILSYAADEILNDRAVFGADLSSIKEGDFAIVTVPLLGILADSTPETVQADVTTIKNLLCIMIDYKVPAQIALMIDDIEDNDRMLETFADDGLLYGMLKEIYANDNYRALMAPTINLAFTMAMKSFDETAGNENVAGDISDLTDEQIKAESIVLADTIGDVVAVIDTLPALLASNDAMASIENVDMAALGKFLDDSRKSILIGNGVTETIVKILSSKSFDSMRGVADILSKHLKNDNDLNATNLMIAVQQFVGILNTYEKTGGQDITALTETLKALNNAFDESTSKIIKEIIDDSSLLGSAMLSIGGGDSGTMQKLFGVFIDELASGNLTEEEMEQEAKAVDYAMKLVKAASEEDGKETLKAIYNDEEGMKEMIATMADSKIAAASINAIAYDEEGKLNPDALELADSMSEDDKDMLVDKCEEYYKQELVDNKDIDEETLNTNIQAVAAIFGRDISGDIASWKADINK